MRAGGVAAFDRKRGVHGGSRLGRERESLQGEEGFGEGAREGATTKKPPRFREGLNLHHAQS